MKKGLKAGWKQSMLGGLGEFGLLSIGAAAGAARSTRGRKINTFAAGMVSWPVASMVGGLVGGPLGLAVSLIATPTIEHTLVKGLNAVEDFGQYHRKTMMGYNYREGQGVYTMRQLAVQEMSGSLMNARQVLGKEGMLMHQ